MKQPKKPTFPLVCDTQVSSFHRKSTGKFTHADLTEWSPQLHAGASTGVTFTVFCSSLREFKTLMRRYLIRESYYRCFSFKFLFISYSFNSSILQVLLKTLDVPEVVRLTHFCERVSVCQDALITHFLSSPPMAWSPLYPPHSSFHQEPLDELGYCRGHLVTCQPLLPLFLRSDIRIPAVPHKVQKCNTDDS